MYKLLQIDKLEYLAATDVVFLRHRLLSIEEIEERLNKYYDSYAVIAFTETEYVYTFLMENKE